jgi:amidase
MDVLTLPATEQLALLDRRALSARELLEAALARVDAENPMLNAVVAQDRAKARAAADASDMRRARGGALPLDGLPITIKDAFDVSELVSTAGAPAYRDRVPEKDAPVVARLRAAGAVIYGKSNVPTFSGDFQSDNPIYGRTLHPLDRSRSPGGSSGGAAVATFTGMSAFEVGSDLGGSIRWPAHCCGLFGHKPSWGLVSTRGHVPPAPGTAIDADLVVAGPLARAARDLEPLLRIMAGPADPTSPARELRPPRVRTPRGLRLAFWTEDSFSPVAAEVGAAVEAAARRLAAAGAVVDERARPAFSFAESFEVFALLQHAMIAAGLPKKIRDRLAEEAVRYAPDDRSHRALQARAARLDAATWARLQERRGALRRAWADFFDDCDAILMPPAPVPAIPHDPAPDPHARHIVVDGRERPYFDLMHWAAHATVARLPATVAPVGLTRDGLPVGVQIIGSDGDDLTTIAVAGMLSNARD